MNEIDDLDEMENHLTQSIKSLRCLWRLMKKNEWKASSEVADSIIDLEETRSMIQAKIKQFEIDQS